MDYISYRVYVNIIYDNVFFIYWFRKKTLWFSQYFMINFIRQIKRQKTFISVLLTFKIFEFVSENLEVVYRYHLGLDEILFVQDVVN